MLDDRPRGILKIEYRILASIRVGIRELDALDDVLSDELSGDGRTGLAGTHDADAPVRQHFVHTCKRRLAFKWFEKVKPHAQTTDRCITAMMPWKLDSSLALEGIMRLAVDIVCLSQRPFYESFQTTACTVQRQLKSKLLGFAHF